MRSRLLRWASRYSQDRKTSIPNTDSLSFRNLVCNCPICGNALDGHDYWLLAQVKMDSRENPSKQELLEKITKDSWCEASNYKYGDMTDNLLQYYFVRCNKKQIALLEVHSYADIWLDDEITDVKNLSEASSKYANEIVGQEWSLF